MLEPEHLPPWTTVFDAISDLPLITNGGGVDFIAYAEEIGGRITPYQEQCRTSSDGIYNHVCHRTNEQNIQLIQHIAPGKNWKSIPEDLRPPRFKNVALKDHTTTYGRLDWEMPARTITAYFNNITAGAFTHPDQHRGISVREAARLQSFPDHYRFTGSLARQCRQVGNAVPCLMAYHVAHLLRELMTTGLAYGDTTHTAAVEYHNPLGSLMVNRPLKGMRFNLDKHLVRT
jgi:DNA (cytosine-5)-methyltransferase 1